MHDLALYEGEQKLWREAPLVVFVAAHFTRRVRVPAAAIPTPPTMRTLHEVAEARAMARHGPAPSRGPDTLADRGKFLGMPSGAPHMGKIEMNGLMLDGAHQLAFPVHRRNNPKLWIISLIASS
jgi:hypothetical protein